VTDLLGEVVLCVGLEHVGAGCVPALLGLDRREGAEAQNGVDLEVPVELGRSEREEPPVDDTSGKEIRLLALEAPGARPREREPPSPRVTDEHLLDLVEERRETLHLVDHHPAPRRQGLHLGGQPVRVAREADEVAVEQQIHPVGVPQYAPQPGGLAGTPRPEQEERPFGHAKVAWIHGQQIDGKSAGGQYSGAPSLSNRWTAR